MKLTISKVPSGMRTMETKKITGFRESELDWLKSLPHEEAYEKLLSMLDERNNKIATEWHNGYGIYGMWFDNEAAYINVGTSCD